MARTAKIKDQPATETAPAAITNEAGADAANRAPRAGSKLESVVNLLESAEGATIAEIMAATGWQQHTVRGAVAGSITKRLGRTLTSEKVESRGRVYRIVLQACTRIMRPKVWMPSLRGRHVSSGVTLDLMQANGAP